MIKSIQIIVLVALSNGLFAQMHYVPQTFSTPYGNITTHQAIYTPMYYGNYGGPANSKFELIVILKNDSIFTFKSRFEAENKKMFVLQKQKKIKRKIFPSETKEIIAYSKLYGRMKGIPADSCWYFKVTSGALNSFACIPVTDRTMAAAIQLGNDGPIIPLTKKNLEEITGSEDPKIVKWLKQNKFSKIIDYYNEKQLVNPSGSQ
ncbi:MAG: hypothetical protein HOP30_22300 [Cyclobacteriaceae bacterium]|nr:hypothetical protein [Cyclobacteriaceae bacterium]